MGVQLPFLLLTRAENMVPVGGVMSPSWPDGAALDGQAAAGCSGDIFHMAKGVDPGGHAEVQSGWIASVLSG